MKVQQILEAKANQKIEAISRDATIADATMQLSEKRIGALIVSEDGKSVDGILSERDIVRAIGKTGAKAMEQSVASLMTSKVETIAPTATSKEALETMSEGRFRHIPVVVDDGKLLGLISIGDVVSARLREIEQENNAMSEMISGQSF